jgi:hypothetical protein
MTCWFIRKYKMKYHFFGEIELFAWSVCGQIKEFVGRQWHALADCESGAQLEDHHVSQI